jgi:DNA-binding helix-hairpin-helix protein with protein kinase domain
VVLSTGATFELPVSRRWCTVEHLLGEGSQGSVFQARVGPQRDALALKWYFDHTGTPTQRASIAELVDRGAPDDRFLWPSELVTLSGEPGFGYLMPLRPDSYVGLSELLTGKVDAPFSVVCTLGAELADSFLSLHNDGLCYRDISFGNVFFEPTTGRPLICDTDNVGVDGRSPSFVLGTRRFMAPEIVRREASPSTATDLYSLSVLLFYLLMVGHPLVGRKELAYPAWDDRLESQLFGAEPLFIFDPVDRSNEPLEEEHGSVARNWELYPEEIRALFTTAFTTGLTDPTHGRVRESVWRSAMMRLRSSIQRCAACRKENFWLGQPGTCWFCERPLDAPLRLEAPGRTLVLNDDTVVQVQHLRAAYGDTTPIATVARHPQRPGHWGLRNETDQTWVVTLPSGEETQAEPGRAVGLLPGTTIHIGALTATIVV